MKTNENKGQPSVRNILRRLFRLPSLDGVSPGDDHNEAAESSVSPLERIREHLHHCGLGQRVRVHAETDGDGFVLEDDDGLVHAKDYAAAVVLVERIWLYES